MENRFSEACDGSGSECAIVPKGFEGGLEGLDDLVDLTGCMGPGEKSHVDTRYDDAVVDEMKVELCLDFSVLVNDVPLALNGSRLKKQVKQ